jgi:hypothetical protein
MAMQRTLMPVLLMIVHRHGMLQLDGDDPAWTSRTWKKTRRKALVVVRKGGDAVVLHQ